MRSPAPSPRGRRSATALLFDQMTVRRLRLACGSIMFAYLVLHFSMHALGNVSFAAMEWSTQLHGALWGNVPGTIALYGAFLVHVALALWALYRRHGFRMGGGEWTRLVLGFAMLPLLFHHFASGRYVYSAFGIERRYAAILTVFFVLDPITAWQQVVALLAAWTHGCLGMHFWLRIRPGYRRAAPALLAFAVLLPTLALLGIWHGGREVAAQAQLHPELQQAIIQAAHLHDPAVEEASRAVESGLARAYVLLLGAALLGRAVRWAAERRRGVVTISYPGGRRVQVPIGWAVLDASRRFGIPHASICGGRGRCTTCRVRVLHGLDDLPPPEPSEGAALARLGVGPSVRLACQLRPRRDISILPLLPPDITADDRRRRGTHGGDREHFVAILFVDIRKSTALVERRLPYDVVFLLNHFFDAVAGAVVEAGGSPNQFVGDGMMAIFGMRAEPGEACRQALEAARLIERRLAEMNRTLADELPEPIAIGIGLHAGSVILGEVGYGDRFLLTAIGDSVHVAARLQDLTKEFGCRMVVSELVAATAGVALDEFPAHEVRVRGREAPLVVRTVGAMVTGAGGGAGGGGPGRRRTPSPGRRGCR